MYARMCTHTLKNKIDFFKKKKVNYCMEEVVLYLESENVGIGTKTTLDLDVLVSLTFS